MNPRMQEEKKNVKFSWFPGFLIIFVMLSCAWCPAATAGVEGVLGVKKPTAEKPAYAPGDEAVVHAEIANNATYNILFVTHLTVLSEDGTTIYDRGIEMNPLAGGGSVVAEFKFEIPSNAPIGKKYYGKFDIRNPYVEEASYVYNRDRPFYLFDVQPAKPGDSEVKADPVETAKKIFVRMVDAMNWKDIDAAVEPVSSSARVTINARANDKTGFKSALRAVMPMLDAFKWDAAISSAVLDAKTGAVRLRVTSAYSANLAEPVGVTSSSLAKPQNLVSDRKRIQDGFNVKADEIYEFNADRSGKMQVTEIVSALPLDAQFMARVATLNADWEVTVAVFGLFYYVEQNDLAKFGELISSDFMNNDATGFKYGKTDFLVSMKADLDHLTAIDHSVRVNDIQFNSDHTEARVPVTWDRRARLTDSQTEWTLKDQTTTLTMRTESGFKLARIEGKPLFGNSSRMTRKTLILSGDLGDTKVTKAISIGDNRNTALASSEDFPDLPSAILSSLSFATSSTAATNTCTTGTLGVSQTFSYTGAVQNFTVPTYCTMTVKAWGGGGGGGGRDNGNGAAGGGSAYSTASVTTATFGDILKIYVGQAGDSGKSAANNTGGAGGGGFGYGSGGRGGQAGGFGTSGAGAGGGGSSAVTNNAGTTFYLVAAGGGGGGGGGQDAGGAGGGGGVNGTAGANSGGSAGATGASGSATGTDGSDKGGATIDGGSGGGGGGGYTAGGTGGSITAPNDDKPGGGGAGGNSTGTVTTGSGTTPGNSGDADRPAGIGAGGTGSTDFGPPGNATRGGNGYVKISW